MVPVDRREYSIRITVNSRSIRKVTIDSHYQLKHADAISDGLILKLVQQLDGGTYLCQDNSKPYQYFVTDQMKLDGKNYKLVWLLEDDELYIGVLNAYRRK